jgi:hypothetical protein
MIIQVTENISIEVYFDPAARAFSLSSRYN